MMSKLTEKGFTLIELLVAMAIAGAIMGVMSASVITIMRVTEQNDEWNVNLRQVQNAGRWISSDALMAQAVSVNTPGVFLSLSWNDWDNNNAVRYVLDGGNLTRSLSINGGPYGPAIIIAQYVVTNPAYTNCTWDANNTKLTVKLRASEKGTRFVEQTYEVRPRPMNW